MTREEIYSRFEELDKRASLGGGVDKIEKQHAQGKMTARERIGMLLDKGTFNELDKLVNHRCTNFGMEKKQIAGDGMVTGYGKIDGRPVFVYAYDFTAHGGFAERNQCGQDCKGSATGFEDGSSRYRFERFGGCTHTGRGEQLGRICLHLLSEYHCIRCYPQISCYSGTLCRRRLLFPGTDRLYLYGEGAEPHVYHGSGCGEDRD